MKISRRQFIKLLLAGSGTVALPGLIAACGPATNPEGPTASPSPEALLTQAARTPRPTPSTTPAAVAVATPVPAATAAPTGRPTIVTSATAAAPTSRPTVAASATAAAANRKKTWAWLRMLAVEGVPTSEADYRAHIRQIDVAMPLNGGRLQADGTWLQEDNKLSDPWPQSLRQLARGAGQLYLPGLSNDPDGTLAVLASTDLQEQAAANLVELATKGRFDSPWDGVYLDLEGVGYDYRSQMSGFFFRLARAVKSAGLLLGISVGGVTAEATGTEKGDDANDLGVVSELADFVDLRCYDYGGPPPTPIAPYWWIEACIQYALKKGVRPGQMTAGLANFSQYWPNGYAGDWQQVTYARALALVKQGQAQVQWLESDANGPVRESYAQVGQARLAITDEKSYRYGLGLIDQYHLLGNTLFAPGMGNEAQWQVIAGWEAGRLS